MREQLPDRILEVSNTTFRPVSPGAEKWLYRPIKCLDYGFVYLVDYMGNDEAIVQAARTSYGAGTKKTSDDRTLIRYLRRHIHTTPSEMVEWKFHCKMPIFVARQWIRHRTASVNEYSGRYSEMLNEFYVPDSSVLKAQSKTNNQGRAEDLTSEQQVRVLDLLRGEYKSQYAGYQEMLDMDLTKELARIGLSVANYTQWYWKIDLHNLLHFLRLRLDSHAQFEIRVFGEAMAQIVKDAVPFSYEAFEDYQLYAMSFTRLELDVLSANQWPMSKEDALAVSLEKFGATKNGEIKREGQELLDKLSRLKFIA